MREFLIRISQKQTLNTKRLGKNTILDNCGEQKHVYETMKEENGGKSPRKQMDCKLSRPELQVT